MPAKRPDETRKRVTLPPRDGEAWAQELRRALAHPPRLESLQMMSLGDVWGERFHSTQRHELIHVLEGRATIQYRKRAFPVGPGATFVIPEGTEHKDLRQADGEYRVLYLFFKWPEAGGLLEALNPRALAGLPDGAKAHLHALMRELEREYLQEAPGGFERMQVLLLEALLALLRGAHRAAPSSGDARSRAAARRREELSADVYTWLQAHYGEPVGLEDLAAHFGVSPFNLCRGFSQARGLSVVESLTQIRMEHARALLEEGKLSVKEIAARIGYADANYFAKVFRRAHGQSPSAFQASLRKRQMP
ncbi:MAG: AraC family transcriptional regulator [Planctomycetota bacterium]|nr:AraC family transcriptional regulator [Planctomycetota bacterium]